MTLVAAAALLGFAASAHCALMCGPLVLAAGFRRGSARASIVAFAAYHAGRLLTYEALAIAAALAGRALATAGLDRALSVVCGLVILQALVPRRAASPGRAWTRVLLPPLARANASLQAAAAGHPCRARLVGGMVNGLLPCGLTYTAATAAAATGGVLEAILFMAAFAVGTVPSLAAVALTGAAVPPPMRQIVRRLAPLAIAAAGIVLIARGVMPAPSQPTGIHAGHGVGQLTAPSSTTRSYPEGSLAHLSEGWWVTNVLVGFRRPVPGDDIGYISTAPSMSHGGLSGPIRAGAARIRTMGARSPDIESRCSRWRAMSPRCLSSRTVGRRAPYVVVSADQYYWT
jgi:sulfite exporter TauE/SafE